MNPRKPNAKIFFRLLVSALLAGIILSTFSSSMMSENDSPAKKAATEIWSFLSPAE